MASPNSSYIRVLASVIAITLLDLWVPTCCLRSPTSQKGPIKLLLQLDSIPHRRFPTAGADSMSCASPCANLPLGGGRLTAPPLFSAECSEHVATNPTTRQQSWSWNCIIRCTGAKFTCRHLYTWKWNLLCTTYGENRSPATEHHSV